MPCQCNSATAIAPQAASASCGCGSAAEPTAACECGTAAASPRQIDVSSGLERVVMELDKRVRALEASARS